jgi:hypothetical protein
LFDALLKIPAFVSKAQVQFTDLKGKTIKDRRQAAGAGEIDLVFSLNFTKGVDMDDWRLAVAG